MLSVLAHFARSRSRESYSVRWYILSSGWTQTRWTVEKYLWELEEGGQIGGAEYPNVSNKWKRMLVCSCHPPREVISPWSARPLLGGCGCGVEMAKYGMEKAEKMIVTLTDGPTVQNEVDNRRLMCMYDTPQAL